METTTKQLLFTDTTGQSRFQLGIEEVQQRCNNLIDVFEASQPFVRITTPDMWLQLVSNPEKFYDDALIRHTEIKSTGNLTPDPGAIANLFNLDRDNFLNITSGKPIKETCLPCKSVKVIRSQKAITYDEFKQFERFLLFQNGTFELFTSAIETEKEKYKFYIENDRQRDIMAHWSDLCRVLNEHHRLGYIGRSALEQIAKACGLRFVWETSQAYLNEDTVRSEVLKVK